MRASGSIQVGNDLEMRPSGRNEGSTVMVVVDKSFLSHFLDGGGQSVDDNKQVGGNEVQLKRHMKDRKTTTSLLRNLARNGNTP